MAYTRRALLFLCCFLFSLAGTTVAQEKRDGDLTIAPYTFRANNGQEVQAELGRLTVRENRRKPDSRLIELAFVRFKSTAAKPAPPIVYLAGGPGGSGIATARGTRFPLFLAMREIGDVIAFDQRATGLSLPSLACTETFDYPLDKAGDPTEYVRRFSEKARACADRLQQQGIDLSAYNTNENADDLEDLRKALGAEKISLWGISYGTHLALTMIRRHESSLHRVILAGTEGPAHTLKLPSQIQANLEKVSQLVKADPAINQKVPDLIALMKQVFAQLEKQPLTIQIVNPNTNQTVGVTISKFDLQRLTASVVGNESVINLPLLYYALAKGDLQSGLLNWVAQNLARDRQSRLGSAMIYAMDCASGVSPARWQRIEREAKASLLGNAIDFPFPYACKAWGNLDLGEAFRAPVKSKLPVLFISGTLDARTPISNAEEVRSGFPNSAHLIIEGAVHSDPLFLSSPQIKEVMLEFMRGEKLSTTRLVAVPLRFTAIP